VALLDIVALEDDHAPHEFEEVVLLDGVAVVVLIVVELLRWVMFDDI